MKYAIISIDDSREDFKAVIRREMAQEEEISIECLDARPRSVDLSVELGKHGFKFADHWKNNQWKKGDIGCLVSHINAWEWVVEHDEPLLVFEDDAILPEGFLSNVNDLMTEVPEGWGVIGLCVNDYGKGFYTKKVDYDEWGQHHVNRPLRPGEPNCYDYGAKRMTRAYQSWTTTTVLYSPVGARSLIDSLGRMGVHMNPDAFIFHRAHCGDFEAYAPKPEYLHLVAQFNEGGHSLIQSNPE